MVYTVDCYDNSSRKLPGQIVGSTLDCQELQFQRAVSFNSGRICALAVLSVNTQSILLFRDLTLAMKRLGSASLSRFLQYPNKSDTRQPHFCLQSLRRFCHLRLGMIIHGNPSDPPISVGIRWLCRNISMSGSCCCIIPIQLTEILDCTVSR